MSKRRKHPLEECEDTATLRKRVLQQLRPKYIASTLIATEKKDELTNINLMVEKAGHFFYYNSLQAI
jgi:hypothetical protein